MSFDIFMQPFRNGQPAPFDRSLIKEAFGPDAKVGDGEISDIVYPEGDRAEVFGAEEPTIQSGLMFSHAGGDRFFEGLWRLAERTGSIIYWPDEGPQCAVTNADTIKHIPTEMLETIGPAEVVHNGRELSAYIAREH